MVDKIPQNLKLRQILPSLVKFLDQEEIMLLYGMRQVGKTSLLYLLIKRLIKKNRNISKQIVYFDLENIADFQLLENLRNYDNFIAILKNKYQVDLRKKVWIFIDEIQYLTNPSSFLKYLYDRHKLKMKFIVTGSSSLEIKKKFSDALTGRIFRFEIWPLNYQEFLNFTNQKRGVISFEKYVLFGGFPAVCLKKESEIKIRLLREIYSLYIRRDIKDLGKIGNILAFNKLVRILAAQVGGLVSEVNLAAISGISRPTIREYLFLLENTFVLNLVSPFFTNPRKEVRKMPKLYFNDSGLRNAALDNFLPLEKRGDMGSLVENTVFSELKKNNRKVHFWRTERKQEVDFILAKRGKVAPIEIKYRFFKKPLIPPSLKVFIKNYKPAEAFVLTKNFNTQDKIGKTKVIFIPCFSLHTPSLGA